MYVMSLLSVFLPKWLSKKNCLFQISKLVSCIQKFSQGVGFVFWMFFKLAIEFEFSGLQRIKRLLPTTILCFAAEKIMQSSWKALISHCKEKKWFKFVTITENEKDHIIIICNDNDRKTEKFIQRIVSKHTCPEREDAP